VPDGVPPLGPDVSRCPLCRTAREAEERHIRRLFLENYCALPTLLRLQDGGYCPRDAAQLVCPWKGLLLSSTFRFVGERELARLNAVRRVELPGWLGHPARHGRPFGSAAFQGRVAATASPARQLRRRWRWAFRTWSISWAPARAVGHTANEGGLCRVHLSRCVAEAEGDTACWLPRDASGLLRAPKRATSLLSPSGLSFPGGAKRARTDGPAKGAALVLGRGGGAAGGGPLSLRRRTGARRRRRP
jgi:hypothetical protein